MFRNDRAAVQRKVGVFTNQHKLLFAAVRSEADVVDTFVVMFRFAFDHCVLRLEATLRLVDGLAERAFTVLGDANVQRCVAVCHEIPLNPNTAKQGNLTIFSNRNRSRIVTGLRNPHVWL
jgi:hypothetical protein